MSLSEDIENGFKYVEEAMGNKTFVWDGQAYVCQLGNPSDTAELIAGGYVGDVSLMVIVRKSEFTDSIYPKEKTDFVSVNGKNYLINGIIESNEALQLILGQPNKRK